MTEVIVVVGAQFGSEGKGAICGHLGKQMTTNDIAIRVAGPNAGHTVVDPQGRTFKLRAVPVAAVTSPDCRLLIAAGSEVDPLVLIDEVEGLEEAGFRVKDRLMVHPSATMLTEVHITKERAAGLVGRLGSTGKGIGAARADRIMRTASTWKDYVAEIGESGKRWAAGLVQHSGYPIDPDAYGKIVIEGTQGYGLGLHTDFYPKTTSSDCRAIDFLAMAGISPWDRGVRQLDVILVARMYPIRVAGDSGPLRGETSWKHLGLPDERTTVTNKVRRVGAWDDDLVIEAIRANGGGGFSDRVTVALTMLDQKYPELRDQTVLDDEALAYVEDLEDSIGAYIAMVGTGPATVVER